jgi:hypothetical protein
MSMKWVCVRGRIVASAEGGSVIERVAVEVVEAECMSLVIGSRVVERKYMVVCAYGYGVGKRKGG